MGVDPCDTVRLVKINYLSQLSQLPGDEKLSTRILSQTVSSRGWVGGKVDNNCVAKAATAKIFTVI